MKKQVSVQSTPSLKNCRITMNLSPKVKTNNEQNPSRKLFPEIIAKESHKRSLTTLPMNSQIFFGSLHGIHETGETVWGDSRLGDSRINFREDTKLNDSTKLIRKKPRNHKSIDALSMRHLCGDPNFLKDYNTSRFCDEMRKSQFSSRIADSFALQERMIMTEDVLPIDEVLTENQLYESSMFEKSRGSTQTLGRLEVMKYLRMAR